eukprot:14263852-Alexandrium_andersonii.AAC.1
MPCATALPTCHLYLHLHLVIEYMMVNNASAQTQRPCAGTLVTMAGSSWERKRCPWELRSYDGGRFQASGGPDDGAETDLEDLDQAASSR